jgi:uncharacterized membrane protein YvbJ
MYCTNCGQNLPGDSVFCSKCGRKLEAEAPPEAAAPEGAAEDAAQTPATPVRPPVMPGIPNAGISNHLALAIIALIFFFPLGIPALIYSTRVDQYLRMSDLETARMNSDKARLFGILGIVIGAALAVVCVIVSAIFASSWVHNYRFYY